MLWLEDLATKYEDEQVERPEWLNNIVFAKEIATVFRWYGKDQERADEALVKHYGLSWRDLKVGADEQLSYIKKSKTSSLSSSMTGPMGGV